VWIFGIYLNHTFFESIIFPASKKHARRCSVSRKSMKSCLLKQFHTSGLQDLNPLPSIFGSQHRSLTTVLVRIIQIHTNFGWLKWLHTKQFSIWEGLQVIFHVIEIFTNSMNASNKHLFALGKKLKRNKKKYIKALTK
jgi:hypothetical protein